jgi:hypothetical protein
MGSFDPTVTSSFLMDLVVCSPCPFPANFLGKREHPLVSFALLQRRFDCHLPAVSPRRAPTLGSPPSSRSQRPESTSGRAPSPYLRSALDVSHVLDGLLLRLPCGLISSHYHVQGFASGVSSHQPGAPTRRRRVPPRRWSRAPTTLRWRQLPERRPRGFVLTDDPQWPVR